MNVWSQFGEDGIIQEVLRRLSLSTDTELNKWACEFGAWDGLHFSNTARLIKEDGYRAVLIEGESSRLADLTLNFPSSSVIKMCSFVTPNGATALDSLLSSTDISIDFDFLSIDIDGMDFYILKSLKKYSPKLICIEFNPTIPNVVNFIQDNNKSVKQGSSAKSISELASEMGYLTIAATHCNLFLLKKEFREIVCPILPTLDEINPNGLDIQYIFSGHDGSLLSNKEFIKLGWHGSFPVSKIQPLPKMIRKFSGDYNKVEKLIFSFVLFMNNSEKMEQLYRKFKKSRNLSLDPKVGNSSKKF